MHYLTADNVFYENADCEGVKEIKKFETCDNPAVFVFFLNIILLMKFKMNNKIINSGKKKRK